MSTRIHDGAGIYRAQLYHMQGMVKRKKVLELLKKLGMQWLI